MYCRYLCQIVILKAFIIIISLAVDKQIYIRNPDDSNLLNEYDGSFEKPFMNLLNATSTIEEAIKDKSIFQIELLFHNSIHHQIFDFFISIESHILNSKVLVIKSYGDLTKKAVFKFEDPNSHLALDLSINKIRIENIIFNVEFSAGNLINLRSSQSIEFEKVEIMSNLKTKSSEYLISIEKSNSLVLSNIFIHDSIFENNLFKFLSKTIVINNLNFKTNKFYHKIFLIEDAEFISLQEIEFYSNEFKAESIVIKSQSSDLVTSFSNFELKENIISGSFIHIDALSSACEFSNFMLQKNQLINSIFFTITLKYHINKIIQK